MQWWWHAVCYKLTVEMRQMNPTWSPPPTVPERRLPVSCVMQDQCGRTERSKAHCICSQFFHSSANTDTPTQVSARWRRLRSSGAVNLAAVETHTRMTVTMASIMLMHFPSSTLASAFSSWTVCCCCCCCSSSFDTRVWHDSSISCSKKELLISSSCTISYRFGKKMLTPYCY